MVPDALALSPAATVGADALRWIARRHRAIVVMPGTAAGTTGRWMHALALPSDHDAIGLPPATSAILSADDILQAGRRMSLPRLIDRRASIRSEQSAWVRGIRSLHEGSYVPVATVQSGVISQVEAADWMGAMRLTTDQSRRLICLRAEHARRDVRIQADQVVSSIDCMIDAQHLLVAIMDCQAESVTLSIDRRLILRISPSGHDAATRAVYLRAAAPAAIAT